MRHIVLFVPVLFVPVLFVQVLLAPTLSGIAAEPQHRGWDAHVAMAAARTGKERLSDKGSDEQRLDDCKVPEARRTKARPAHCPAGSGDNF